MRQKDKTHCKTDRYTVQLLIARFNQDLVLWLDMAIKIALNSRKDLLDLWLTVKIWPSLQLLNNITIPKI